MRPCVYQPVPVPQSFLNTSLASGLLTSVRSPDLLDPTMLGQPFSHDIALICSRLSRIVAILPQRGSRGGRSLIELADWIAGGRRLSPAKQVESHRKRQNYSPVGTQIDHPITKLGLSDSCAERASGA